MDIYGTYKPALEAVMARVKGRIEAYGAEAKAHGGSGVYEHLSCRLKSEASMEKKLISRGLPLTPKAALHEVRDAIGIRIVCRFIDDVYENAARIKAFAGADVVK